ncbi:lactoylglutathione lyase [Vibrio zhanjiangensis]|uniref:Aldoketomutase n=1 Tax=Vibrio zhanjiangensis TaxID=1046128 RepID=A0ABQ6EWS2_9VIBR|nr:VOC family protein [Vibrio zhanjiangensis]GLT17647.1 lactoylglutathione lyase [Vibrio zhanjiangensis]
MTKLVHTMIRVHDLSMSIEFYRKALGLNIKEQFVFKDYTLTYLANQETDFELELTHNHNEDTAYTHGSGYGHVAVTVDCIHHTHKTLKELDIPPSDIKTIRYQDRLLATLFFIVDPDGYKIEFLQRNGRYN